MRRLPLPDERRPLIFAHRGCSSLAPENTLASFAKARALGAPGIELDIHRCLSGEIVVIHDYTTGRTGDADVGVEASDLRTLQAIDVGSRFSSEFALERIPLLAEVFDLLGDGVYYDIEIKSRSRAVDGKLESALAELIRSYRLAERACVSSFNPLSLRSFKAICPEVPTANIYCLDAEVPWFLRRGQGRWIAGCDYIKPKADLAGRPSSFPGRLFRRRRVVAWTVDVPDEARALIARGVDGIITNRPQDIIPALR